MARGRRTTVALLSAGLLLTSALAPAAPATAHPTGQHGSDGEWRQLRTFGHGPSDRSAPAAVGLGTGVYVFGGVFDDFDSGTNTFFNDLYRLDTRFGFWLPYPVRNAPPPARAFAAAAAHQPSDRMFVFGGSTFNADNTEFQPFDDLWAFDARRLSWDRLEPANQGPGARSGATMWVVGDALYVFGGIDATFRTHSDVWKYDLDTNLWTLLNGDDDPTAPPPRHVAQAGQTASGGVLTLYGGEGLDPEVGFTVLADTWQYDLAAGAWREVSPSNDIAPPRNYGAAGLVGDDLYLHGGDIPGGSAGCGAPFPQNPTEQLWTFDGDTGQWRQLDPRGDPLPALKRHAAAVVRDTMYVVSGWDFQCQDDQGPGQVWNSDVYSYAPAGHHH